MRIKSCCWFVLLGLMGVLSRAGFADEPRPNGSAPGVPTVTHTTVISEDEQAIRKTAEAFEVAYRSKNAQAIAAQFTPNGEIVDTEGNIVHGREAIADAFRRIFEDRPQGRMLLNISSVRFVAPGIAVEEGTTRLVRVPKEPPVYGRYAAVDVKVDGQWLVASTRDLTPNSELIPASERLKALEFLIGDWVDEAEESIIATSYRWGEGRTCILHDFAVKRAGKPLLKGSQRIGWDPLAPYDHVLDIRFGWRAQPGRLDLGSRSLAHQADGCRRRRLDDERDGTSDAARQRFVPLGIDEPRHRGRGFSECDDHGRAQTARAARIRQRRQLAARSARPRGPAQPEPTQKETRP